MMLVCKSAQVWLMSHTFVEIQTNQSECKNRNQRKASSISVGLLEATKNQSKRENKNQLNVTGALYWFTGSYR